MAWIRKGTSGRYHVVWRDLEGRERSQTFRLKDEARDFKSTTESNLAGGNYHDPALGRIPLSKFWPRFLEASPHLRPATVDLYERLGSRYILPRLGARAMGSLSRLDVEAWVAELTLAGAGPATIDASYRVLRRVLSAAEAAGVVARNAAVGVKRPRVGRERIRFLSAQELRSIADVAPDRDRAMIVLLGLCGLRIGEAAALLVEDLELLRRRVRITKAAAEIRGRVTVGPTKTGASRAVAIPLVVAEELAAHVDAFPPGPAGLVFTSPDGRIIHRTNWRRRVWVPALKRAGIAEPLPRVHDLRHTAASLAIATGAHPRQIQDMLGHSSITVTLDRYGHLFPALAEQLAERLDEAFRATKTGPPAEGMRKSKAGKLIQLTSREAESAP